MSVEDLYEFISGENQTVTRILQYPAGTGLAYIRDTNRVKLLGYNIEIWSAETGGTQLVLDTDYNLAYIDANISAIEGFTVYAGYQVLTPAYQGVNLYITASIVGGYTSRPYRPTYESVTANTTFIPASVDDSIFADSSTGPVAITLADGTYKNQRAAVICSGVNDVTVSGTGLDDADYSNVAVQFIWSGAGWLQLGGAGGAGTESTYVLKWERPDASLYPTVTNDWEDGLFYLGVSFDYDGTSHRSNGNLAIGDDSIHRFVVLAVDIAGGASTINIEYNNGTSGAFTVSATGTDFTNLSFEAIYKYEVAFAPERATIYEIDTTAGDVAVVLPTPAPGMVRSYYNIGTGGNHVTGLPDGITLGDGKGIAITYGGTDWRYEDVPIDDYSIAAVVTSTTSAIAYVKKWAGGAMEILYAITAGGNTGNKTITHPEIWVGPYYTVGGVGDSVANAGRSVINRTDITPMDTIQLINDAGSATGSSFRVKYEGRWK